MLVVIYNHHYPDNVAKVEHIYGKRFSRIHHLMPFYESGYESRYESGHEKQQEPSSGSHKFNVIPVYDSSHYHQSFIANGLPHYYYEDASHYIFIQDDLMLKPQINEDNYQKFFNLTSDSAYLTGVDNLPNAYSLLPWKEHIFFGIRQHWKTSQGKKFEAGLINYLFSALRVRPKHQWTHAPSAYNLSLETPGLHWPSQLVNHIEAMQIFKRHNLLTDHINLKKAVRRHKKGIKAVYPGIKKRMMLRAILEYCITGKDSYRPYQLEYPLAYSGASDIFIVPNKSIHKFATHCGIFAAYNLFAEIAIPTAIILTTDTVVKIKDINYKSFMQNIGPKAEHQKDLQSIVKHWPEDCAYIHPIKLSGIRMN